MKIFSNLIYQLSNSKEEQTKISLLRNYFSSESTPLDKDNALNLLSGNCPKRIISSKQLKSWSSEVTGYPNWLIERSAKEVGNFAQTFCLLMRGDHLLHEDYPISDWLLNIDDLYKSPEKIIKSFIKNDLICIDEYQRLILLKLLTGTFKSPVTKNDIIVSIAQLVSIKPEIVSLRLYDCKEKRSVSMKDLLQEIDAESKKVPWNFPLTEAIDQAPEVSKPHENWDVFGFKEGIEAQLIKHEYTVHLWTRGNEIITNDFPGIIAAAKLIKSNVVIYGQIVINNHETTMKNTREVFEIWDLLEGKRDEFKEVDLDHSYLNFKETIDFSSIEELESFHAKCREHGFSGIYFRRKKEPIYYFWKANSFSIKAILMYVELGAMGKSGIISMTFGVLKGEELVPIAKLSSFEDSVNISEIIDFVKANTIERFGPVRTIKPELVYELYFDKVSKSSRRKSGLVLTNPEIKRKLSCKINEANNLEYLEGLI